MSSTRCAIPLASRTDIGSISGRIFSVGTLPRIPRATDETTRTVRTLNRAVNELTENPQMLIYGDGAPQPGPGEPGFRASGGRR